MAITAITTLKQLAALEAAVRTASEQALKFADTEDGGTCNFDSCVLGVKIPKRLRERTSLKLQPCTWGYYRGWYFVQDLPTYGQGNMRTRMAEAASESLCKAGFNSAVYYEID